MTPLSTNQLQPIGALAAEIRRRLGPPTEPPDAPLVSIVVLNRDGAAQLRRLLTGLAERTDYPEIELVVVDNASGDESLEFLRRVEAPFPISIVANPHNESFSDACNQGAEDARGELLLFLNNDVEPFEPGWLRELVNCLRSSGAGAVAATLLCRDEEHDMSFRHGHGIQHRGLRFREEAGMLCPVLHGWEADPLDERLGEDVGSAAVAAACLLIERATYSRVSGFSRGYFYGAEDVDLSFKLRAEGLGVVCSGRSMAIHHPASTRRAAPFEEERARKLANRRVLWERWGPRMRREYELDVLNAGGLWAEEDRGAAGDESLEAGPAPTGAEVEALRFCFKADPLEPALRERLEAIRSSLTDSGHRCLLLEGDRVDDSPGLEYDIAVHLRGPNRYIPKRGQLNVLWWVSHLDASTEIECSRYDLVMTGPEQTAEALLAATEDRVGELSFPLRLDGAGSAPMMHRG